MEIAEIIEEMSEIFPNNEIGFRRAYLCAVYLHNKLKKSTIKHQRYTVPIGFIHSLTHLCKMDKSRVYRVHRKFEKNFGTFEIYSFDDICRMVRGTIKLIELINKYKLTTVTYDCLKECDLPVNEFRKLVRQDEYILETIKSLIRKNK